VTQFYQPKLRLTQIMKEPGGKTVADAVTAATEAVGKLSDRAVVYVDQTLAQLDAAFAALPPAFEAQALAPIYQYANNLIGAASTARLVALDRTAYDFCDLVDRMSANGRWDRQAIKVYIDALHLFRRGDIGEAAVEGVTAGLKRVRQHYLAANTPAPKAG
jgi:hypothetical protein